MLSIMPRRHKPSLWQPTNWRFDRQLQREVKKYYPPEVMEEIIKAARLEKIEPNSAKQRKLAIIIKNNIIILGVWTKNWLNLSKRPTPAQRKAALRRIEKKVHTLNEALKKLDYDSSDDLRSAMLSDPFSHQALSTDPELGAGHSLRGYAKFKTLLDIISKLEQWAAKAQEETKKPKDGDKRADVKRWFAEGLIDIWIMIGYKKPTITWRTYYPEGTPGPLMEFTNAAARPLGLLPMEAALRQAIKEWKKKGP
jgi:hypothetical protein